ncbi:MAG: PKD domain-containing protein, partial [Dehalococcoidia bacterium]
TTNPLYGVWGSSATDVFAVGIGGTIVHYNGTSWSAMSSGTTDLLWGVWGSSATDVFAVGIGGIILHYLEVPAPVAAFTANITTGGAIPLNVQFTDQSTGTITGWQWDFENDATVDSTEQNPSHPYPSVGTYTVSLTVTGPGGSDTETKVNYINATGCFIATASYGTPSNQDIAALRSFRDSVLDQNPLGKAFINVYYSTSPPIASALAENEGLRTATRSLLVVPLTYLARAFSYLVYFAILGGAVLGLLFLARRRKLALSILKSFGIGILTAAALAGIVFSLGYAAYTWPFSGTIAAYILPMIIPLSVVVAVILTLRPGKTPSRSSSPLSPGGA